MAQEDFVADEEVLYRCIFFGKNAYIIIDNQARITSQAFSDRQMRPSVDRANLCNHDPHYSQKNEKDGVVSLVATDIRIIDNVVQNDSKGQPEFSYKFDVLPRPLEENPAHAQIEGSPEYRNKQSFKKLLERLAKLAEQRGWEIEPYELREMKN